MTISLEDFEKVELRVGTVVAASVNRRARKPAYKLKLDMGDELGIKGSSAQITTQYQPEDLIGRQLIVVANFAPMRIGDAKSEVRVLGADTPEGYVLFTPDKSVANGTRLL